ncbi:MAG: D-alanyl-D-alanine carboxypeptidase [Firmicutes bacterium]|nr:D-alanyl-D-alanine carboxypeptidase [Bacillota bacterium]
MKRYLKVLALALLLIFSVSLPALALNIDCSAAILIDAESGRILYQENAHESLPVASTTKILSTLVALEHYRNLDEEVTVPADYVNPGEASIWLVPGETLTVRDLLYAMMLRSANDAAEVLAIHTAGSIEGFSELMNDKTAELGLGDSLWSNPNGLSDVEHYSSAYDLAMITRAAFEHEVFKTIVSTEKYTMPWAGHDYDRVVNNTNEFLTRYMGADGVKTGTTTSAGQCLVASVTRDGMCLIGVVLNSQDRYADMTTLMDYGFNNFEQVKAGSSGDVIETVNVKKGRRNNVSIVLRDDVRLIVEKGHADAVSTTINLPKTLETPIERSTAVGTVVYTDDAGNQYTYELYPAISLERYTFGLVMEQVWDRVWSVWLDKAA